MSTVCKLTYRSDLGELRRVCEDVTGYCRRHGIDPDTELALMLCLNELFSNTVKYGYRAAEGSDGQAGGCFADSIVEIYLEKQERGVVARYCDRGRPFDPFANVSALPDMENISPETLPTSGFGMHLLHKLCSQAHYTRQGDTNVILLTFVWE